MKQMILFMIMLALSFVDAETTSIFLSHNDYSCVWEDGGGGYNADSAERGYRLATNILKYGARGKTTVTVGQVIHGGDWDCDPGSLTNIVNGVNSRTTTGFAQSSGAINLETTTLASIDVLFLWGHSFSLSSAAITKLRYYLDQGTVLFIDDCNATPDTNGFSPSVSSMIASMYGQSMTNIRTNHPIFSSFYPIDGTNSGITGSGYGNQNFQYPLRALEVIAPNAPEPSSVICLMLGIVALGLGFKKRLA